MKNSLIFVILLMAVAVAGFVAGLRWRGGVTVSERETVVRCDTVVRHDTVRVVEPRLVEVHRTRNERVAVVGDTLVAAECDSAATVVVPMERRVYADSAYRAVVSGFNARLDSIELYPSTRTVTVTRAARQSRWGIGVMTGVALTPRGVQPAIGVGVCYRIR